MSKPLSYSIDSNALGSKVKAQKYKRFFGSCETPVESTCRGSKNKQGGPLRYGTGLTHWKEFQTAKYLPETLSQSGRRLWSQDSPGSPSYWVFG